MSALSLGSRLDRARLTKIADGLAVAVAVSLPWSTSATGILLVLWLIALIPTLTWSDVRHQLTTAVGGLPVLLLLLGVVGMAWADVTWHERWGGLGGFVRLLAIPLLMAQFRRSEGGQRVFIGFLIACVAVLIASVVVTIWPNIRPGHRRQYGGSGQKLYCAKRSNLPCAPRYSSISLLTKARLRLWKISAALAALALAFLGDIVFITTGRTALVIIPVLVVLYGIRHSGWKGVFGAVAVLSNRCRHCVVSLAVFARASERSIYTETMAYEHENKDTSSGERIQFWTRSIRTIENAPFLGRGTGSIADQFRRALEGQPGAHGTVSIISTNPHNQTFAVGIQLGLLGIAVLWAMWITQVMFFWGNGSLAWIGLVVVTANIVGSLFNSFIFDFTEGWLYVIGVGVAAGMLQRKTLAVEDRKEEAVATAAS